MMIVIWVNQNMRVAISRHLNTDILPSALFPAEEPLPLRCSVCSRHCTIPSPVKQEQKEIVRIRRVT